MKENILLKKKLIIYQTRDENYEALAMTLHKDEIYKRVKSEMDQQLLQNLKDSRWVNQQQSDIIGKLERSLSEKSNLFHVNDFKNFRNTIINSHVKSKKIKSNIRCQQKKKKELP